MVSYIPRVLESLSNAKRNCITHTVKCVSRAEDAILPLTKKILEIKGLKNALEFARKERKAAGELQWATW